MGMVKTNQTEEEQADLSFSLCTCLSVGVAVAISNEIQRFHSLTYLQTLVLFYDEFNGFFM